MELQITVCTGIIHWKPFIYTYMVIIKTIEGTANASTEEKLTQDGL